jgi:hypothetical protein
MTIDAQAIVGWKAKVTWIWATVNAVVAVGGLMNGSSVSENVRKIKMGMDMVGEWE